MGLVPFRQPSTLFCCCHLVLHIFYCIAENKASLFSSLSLPSPAVKSSYTILKLFYRWPSVLLPTFAVTLALC